MPLSFDAPDAGRVNLELRRQRGGHIAKATGPAERLGKLLPPELVQIRGEDTVLSFDLIVFLSYPLLRVKADMRNLQVIKYLVCIERMASALEKALSKHTDDTPVSASVLRAALRRIADELVANGDGDAFEVPAADLYAVQFTAYPEVAGDDDTRDATADWIKELTFGMLLDAEGSLANLAQIELCLFMRFDEAKAFAKDGPWVRFSNVLLGAYGRYDSDSAWRITRPRWSCSRLCVRSSWAWSSSCRSTRR